VSAELTYGLDRIGMMLQGRTAWQDLVWGAQVTWGDLWLQNEKGVLAIQLRRGRWPAHFEMFQRGSARRTACSTSGSDPGYDCVIKCSHLFNLLDARGEISVSERVGYTDACASSRGSGARVRNSARRSGSRC